MCEDDELDSIPLNKAEAKLCLSESGFANDDSVLVTVSCKHKHINSFLHTVISYWKTKLDI